MLAQVFAVLFFAAAAFAAAPAASHPRAKTISIVIDFDGPHSARAISGMKQEFEGIMRVSGLAFQWRSRQEAVGADFEDLVVVRFKGKCILEPVSYLYDERGPLAFTHSTDGAVLPFSEVACDKVTASVRSAMFGGDYARADLLLGRALGRVVAHELVHFLTQSSAHADAGVTKTAFSGAQLISENLPLNPKDIERLHAAAAH